MVGWIHDVDMTRTALGHIPGMETQMLEHINIDRRHENYIMLNSQTTMKIMPSTRADESQRESALTSK